MLADADAFYLIHKSEWPQKIPGHALSTLYHRQQNKVDLLPCTEDLVYFMKLQRLFLKLNPILIVKLGERGEDVISVEQSDVVVRAAPGWPDVAGVRGKARHCPSVLRSRS